VVTIDFCREVIKEMLIGILSDTHGLLRQEVIDRLNGVDMIIHAGDIDDQSVVDQLKNLSSSLTVVRGNADKEWAEQIPQEAWLEILGNKLFVIHNKGKISCDVGIADIIIYGHTHKYSLAEKDGQIWFNPGCCGKRKKDQEVSFAILEIRGKREFDFRKIVIDNGEPSDKLPKDIDRIISKAMKLTDKGKSHTEIAEILKIPEKLSENICRMYLTHPGIDVVGILKRIS
jgi:putative phosphoesterase